MDSRVEALIIHILESVIRLPALQDLASTFEEADDEDLKAWFDDDSTGPAFEMSVKDLLAAKKKAAEAGNASSSTTEQGGVAGSDQSAKDLERSILEQVGWLYDKK